MALNVFITGASSGIGEALAYAYAADGATLGLLARRANRLAVVADRIACIRSTYTVDVNSSSALREAAMQHMRLYGCPDIVIANAGISAGTLTEMQQDLIVFDRIVRTNLLATVATFQPFIEAMKLRRRGTLVAIASVAGLRGLPGASAYCASKAALISYCESLRIEMARFGIKVVTLAPGFIETAMTQSNPYPMPFLMNVDDFARQALKVIARGSSFKVIPWQMNWISKLLRVMPNKLFDSFFSHARYKPRINVAALDPDDGYPNDHSVVRQPGGLQSDTVVKFAVTQHPEPDQSDELSMNEPMLAAPLPLSQATGQAAMVKAADETAAAIATHNAQIQQAAHRQKAAQARQQPMPISTAMARGEPDPFAPPDAVTAEPRRAEPNDRPKVTVWRGQVRLPGQE